jgi:hypothetical protein
MYLSVSGELWGIAIVCLDQESMIADIEYPACFNGKSSAAQLLINELYSLMIRKGAGVIQCKAPWSKKEQMAAVNFSSILLLKKMKCVPTFATARGTWRQLQQK